MAENKAVPWANGLYKSDSNKYKIYVVNGPNVKDFHAVEYAKGITEVQNNPDFLQTWEFGEFTPTDPLIEEATGKKIHDVKLGGQIERFAVLGEDKKSFTLMGYLKNVENFTLISPEDFKDWSESWESAKAPNCPYKLQPDFQGKLIWISGPAGSGKTTTAFKLAKEKEFVYYEADCFFIHLNPYISKEFENPMEVFTQLEPLKGE